jgi:oxygen-independent coproporphyrinogen-3 oxidase
MRGLRAKIESCFALTPDGEYSIEIDPRTLESDTLPTLAAIGFNRISIGVQDFDPAVQAAVNRVQSEADTAAAIQSARSLGFRSINLDLIYGLPRQTLESVGRTIDTVIGMAPDRIALYNYAHIPTLFKPQRRIDEQALPDAQCKIGMFSLAVERLTAAGYVYIGMDHFALPGDELTVAQRQGRLARNFQGYSTHADCDIVSVGVSAIGMLGPTYSQNHRGITEYYDELDHGRLPVCRGMELTADDLTRRAVIHGLMCNMELSKRAIETAWLIDFDRYFAPELRELEGFAQEGLVELDADWITVTPPGRFLVRTVCMPFDRYLRQDRERRSYSKVI